MIRREIESLAIWFVVASVLVFMANLFTSVNGWQNLDRLTGGVGGPGNALIVFTSLGVFASLIDNIAVGLWLFRRSSIYGYNRWLWAAFGVAGSLIGGVLYLLARFSDAEPPNKSKKAQPAAGGTH